MNKTYVFFVGGTGARVLRSLTMLLASGCRMKDGGAIVPIVIDYDVKNGDLKKAKDLLDCYCSLSNIAEYEENEEGFFRQKLEIKEGSYAAIQYENNSKTFGDFLSYDSMANREGLSPMKKMLESLFDTSENKATAELKLDMTVGFKGNPNIGSVVFDDYFRNKEWHYDDIASSVQPGDKVFVVGSIFGGTGSSGIPQLIKNFEKKGSSSQGNYQGVQNAIKGACLVLPYFGVKISEESAVDSRIFNSKAKAALSYYDKEINNSLDEIYYVGCRDIGQYENHQGGEDQKNDAHLVEFISALSVLEFANRKFDYNHKDKGTTAYEFGINYGYNKDKMKLHETSYLDIFDFDGANPENNYYLYHLNAFAYFCKYYTDYISTGNDKNSAYYKSLAACLGEASGLVKQLSYYAKEFRVWSEQMAKNEQIKFMPYDFSKEEIGELLCVNEKKPYPNYGWFKSMKKSTMEPALNNISNEYKEASISCESIFLRCAYAAGCKAAQQIIK